MSLTNGARQDEERLVVAEANMTEALRSHYRRTKADAVDAGPLPHDLAFGGGVIPGAKIASFEEFMCAEQDGEEAWGEYEWKIAMLMLRRWLRWLKSKAGIKSDEKFRPGPVSNLLMQLFAAGRAAGDPFFSSLSFTESGLLFSQTKAAASFRGRMISGILEEAGMAGTRLPGQKSPLSIPKYAKAAKESQARLGSNRAKKSRPRQGSFLKQLKTGKSGNRKTEIGKSRQATFTRKLTSKTKQVAEAAVQPKITPTISGQRPSGGLRQRENGGGVTGASLRSGGHISKGGVGASRSGQLSSLHSPTKAALKIA